MTVWGVDIAESLVNARGSTYIKSGIESIEYL